MARNVGVVGRIVDNTGAARSGMTVRAFDKDVWPFRDALGAALTGTDGSFEVTYAASSYGPAEKKPDIVVEVSDFVSGSTVFVTQEYADVAVATLDIGTMTLEGKNISTTGRVVDEHDVPLPNLVVVVTDLDDVSKDDVLGRATTGPDGRFRVSYSPTAYTEVLGDRPDIVISVLDAVGIRELATTGLAANVDAAVLDAGDIVVARALADGWPATLGDAAPSRLSMTNQVEILVDNEAAWAELIAMIDGATSAIHLMQLWIDTDCIATFAGDGTGGTTQAADRVLEALLAANHRGVAVRVLLNENAVFPDTVDEVRKWFGDRGPNSVTVRPFPLTYETMHGKALVADPGDASESAMIIGSPFQQGYWDTTLHPLVEPRRGAVPLVGIGDRPVHDVCVALRGPAVTAVAELFATLWNFRADESFAGHDRVPVPTRADDGPGNEGVQAVRTLPRDVLPGQPAGETGILEAYQRAIAAARDYVYLETQYFSSAAIVCSLRLALAATPTLDVILVINEDPDIPTYKGWQNRRLVKEIGYPHPRLVAFSLWSSGLGAGRPALQQIYVHSKTAIVDDRWATVGTANLDGISMDAAVELPFGRRRRSLEVNAVLFDGIAGAAATGAVARYRHALWSEHLGATNGSRPIVGWLTHWRERAAANVDRLARGDPPPDGSFVLPYRPERTEAQQLRALGVDPSRYEVID